MSTRLSIITTRTGDDGSTGLADGTRLAKSSLRIAAMGEVDETNACLGLLLTEALPAPLPLELVKVQHDLFDVGADLCMPGHAMLGQAAVLRLEGLVAELNQDLQPLQEFILPGGSKAAAYAHLARTVCRRAERTLVALNAAEPGQVPVAVLLYFNRLSDLLFVVARWVHHQAGVRDVLWQKGFTQSSFSS